MVPSVEVMVAPDSVHLGPELGHREAPVDRAAAPEEEGADDDRGQGIEVVHRQRRPHDVVGRAAPADADLACQGLVVVVAEHAALGEARRAAGVDEGSEVGRDRCRRSAPTGRRPGSRPSGGRWPARPWRSPLQRCGVLVRAGPRRPHRPPRSRARGWASARRSPPPEATGWRRRPGRVTPNRSAGGTGTRPCRRCSPGPRSVPSTRCRPRPTVPPVSSRPTWPPGRAVGSPAHGVPRRSEPRSP